MKYYFLLSICFLSVFSYGQSKKFTFTLGSEYSLPRRSNDLSFLGNEKDGIVNLCLKKEELTVLRFDPKTLIKSSEKVIQLPERTKYFESERLIDFGNKYYWIHSDWDKDSQTEYLYYDKVDVSNGKITETNKKMLQATKIAPGNINSVGWVRFNVGGKYDFNFDSENKKLLVSYRLFPEERRDSKNFDKIGLYVFDESMNKLWSREYTMPYNEAIMDNSDFSIDANGNAYMLAKVYDSEKRKEKDKETGKAGYHYEVFKFTKDNKQIIRTTITVGDYFIKEASLVESSLHEMLVTCTYSKAAKKSGTDGIFLAMMDQNGKINKYKNGYYEFPLEELTKFESARSKRRMERKDDYEAPSLTVRNVVVEADGSVLVACEEYYVVAQTYMSTNGTTRTTYTYYYEDILASKIDAKGNFVWLRKVAKKQRGSSGRGTMSFKLVSDALGDYFLFLDNKKNMELAEDEVPKYHIDGFGGQVVVAKIDKKGEVTKEIVFDTREENVMIFPSLFARINGSQFIGRASIKGPGAFKPVLITVN